MSHRPHRSHLVLKRSELSCDQVTLLLEHRHLELGRPSLLFRRIATCFRRFDAGFARIDEVGEATCPFRQSGEIDLVTGSGVGCVGKD